MPMQYIQKITVAGDTIEIEKTRSARFGKRIPRGGNENKTPKAVKELNRRNAVKKLTRLLNENYHPNDLHIVLTYADDYLPATPKEGQKLLDDFKRDMRKRMRDQGKDFLYIAVTEGLARRLHHHLVINATDIETITACWPWGKMRIYPLDDKREYSKLAEYLVKETDRTFRPGGQYLQKTLGRLKKLGAAINKIKSGRGKAMA